MKRFLLFASLVLVGLVSSCKKDPKPEELIIGKWSVTKLIVDSEDVVASDPVFETRVELEFLNNGSLVFDIRETDYTVTPVEVEEYAVSGSYTWEDDKITLTIDSGGDILTVTGNVEVTKTRLIITATSGDIIDFFSILEAVKL